MSRSVDLEPGSDGAAAPDPRGDLPGWLLALGLLGLLLVYAAWQGTLRVWPAADMGRLLVMDAATLAPAVLLAWAIAYVPEALARRRRKAPTRLRRNVLIGAAALTLVLALAPGSERHKSQSAARGGAEMATKGPIRVIGPESRTTPAATPAPPVERPAAPARMTPETRPKAPPPKAPTLSWVQITEQPAYREASTAERLAIRDLYWRICVELRIPREHRHDAHDLFLREWEIIESEVPAAPGRTMSVAEYLRQQKALEQNQPGARSPVSAATMDRWCGL